MKLKKGIKVLMRGWWGLVRRRVKGLYEDFIGQKFVHVGGILYNVQDFKREAFVEVEEIELKKDDVDKGISANGTKTE